MRSERTRHRAAGQFAQRRERQDESFGVRVPNKHGHRPNYSRRGRIVHVHLLPSRLFIFQVPEFNLKHFI